MDLMIFWCSFLSAGPDFRPPPLVLPTVRVSLYRLITRQTVLLGSFSILAIDEADLREALNAAHAIGDDTLGQRNESQFTHGSSAQRMTWFRRGFDSGDARQCDTFNVPANQL